MGKQLLVWWFSLWNKCSITWRQNSFEKWFLQRL